MICDSRQFKIDDDAALLTDFPVLSASVVQM